MASWNHEATTHARDASIMRTHVLPQWETWPLGKIDHLAVQTWITRLSERLSPATVAECRRLTSAVMRSAVRNRLIPYNPCDDIKIPKRRRRDTDQVIERVLFRRRLLPAVPHRHRGLVGIAGGCGLRWGEAVGLCDDAIDLDRARLRVVRTVIEVAGHTSFKPYPKSAAGVRTVPIPSWLVAILREHLAHYPRGEGGLIFANEVGGALRRTLFRSRVWRPSLVRAGLLGSVTEDRDGRYLAHWTDAGGRRHQQRFDTEPAAVQHVARHQAGGLRFHDLRHSYATWLVDDGVPPNMAQRVMGHERSSTTLDLYTRRTDDATRILRALDDDPDDGDALVPA